MSSAVATDAPWRARLRPLRGVVTWRLLGLRGLTLERLAWTFVFAAGFALWSTTANVLIEKGFAASSAELAEALRMYLSYYVILFFPQMLALTLADNLPLRGAGRLAALGFAVALGALTPPLVGCPVMQDSFPDCPDLLSWAAIVELSNRLIAGSVYASVIAAAYLTRRRDRELAAALHASQLARIDAQRRTLDADLQVMQARVEPAFLFAALRDTAALYESDWRAGDRLLDQLIQYLRAALPHVRVSGSTVAQEACLLRAYLNILALRSAGNLVVALQVAQGLDDARVPPMMLVPLLAPRTDSQSPATRRTGSIRVDIRNPDGRLRMAIAATGEIARSIASSAAIDEVRERLAALYGPRATLAVERNASDTLQLIMEMPNERTDRGHR